MPPYFVKDIALGLLMGTYGVLLLYGMTVMQAYQYYSNFSSDRTLLKVLVGVILLLETVNLTFSCHHDYFYLIEHYGEPEYIVRIVWSSWLSVEIGFVIAWLVNMFFVRRIYVLSLKKLWLAIFIGILVTIRPAFGFTAASYALVYPEWAVFHEHVQWMFITGLSVGLVVDCLIAGTLYYYLLKNRDTSTRSTRNIVNLLLWYTINTTAILTFFAAIEMIFLLVYPKTLTFLGLFSIQIQLYANCFLTTLNARQALRNGVADATPKVTALRVATLRTENQTHLTTSDLGIKTNTFIDTQSERGYPGFNMVKVEPV